MFQLIFLLPFIHFFGIITILNKSIGLCSHFLSKIERGRNVALLSGPRGNHLVALSAFHFWPLDKIARKLLVSVM